MQSIFQGLVLALMLISCGDEDIKTEEACSTLELDQCAERADCVELVGSEMISNTECYTLGEEETLGCISSEELCNDYTTPANNGNGTTFLMTSDCLPEGYEVVIFEYYPECSD